ncbi:5'/3'-nucleotidase SurE [Candidatus Desantisbacteria bacterium]|nr:5'/3'-nucleotidase SurE [Candidatus Desantisbacteria bacterium]
MNILITNDDGVHAHGLSVLKTALSSIARVMVIAPDRERSATGHSLTLTHPVRVEEIGEDSFVTDGTPADCVNIGIMGLISIKPDMIVSGINPAPNLGDDITYSGTVAAAMEGTLLGIPSFAISINGSDNMHLESAGMVAVKIAQLIEKHGLPEGTFLNVNVPNLPSEKIKGMVITRQGKRAYREELIKRVDPRGKIYYWIGSKGIIDIQEEGTDVNTIAGDMISITPLHLDLTDYAAMQCLEGWISLP